MDYLPYYKRYNIDIDKNKSVYDLLLHINDIEKFAFDSSDNCYVEINNLFMSATTTTIADLVQRVGTDWVIAPISKFSAKLDLIVDMSDYISKLELFREYISDSEYEEYKSKYILEYYASNTLNYNRDYMGDHNLLIACDVIECNLVQKDMLTDMVKDELEGIYYHTKLSDRIFTTKEHMDHINSRIKKLYYYCGLEYDEPTVTTVVDKNLHMNQKFTGFNIATYGIDCSDLIKESDAKEIKLKSARYDLGLLSQKVDKKFSLLIAGEILLEAKDSGADFIIVESKKELNIFDGMQKKIEKAVGRDIILPVITKDQYIMLLEGEKSISTLGFMAHRVKVTFLEY
jgi:hypothetical protein